MRGSVIGWLKAAAGYLPKAASGWLLGLPDKPRCCRSCLSHPFPIHHPQLLLTTALRICLYELRQCLSSPRSSLPPSPVPSAPSSLPVWSSCTASTLRRTPCPTLPSSRTTPATPTVRLLSTRGLDGD